MVTAPSLLDHASEAPRVSGFSSMVDVARMLAFGGGGGILAGAIGPAIGRFAVEGNLASFNLSPTALVIGGACLLAYAATGNIALRLRGTDAVRQFNAFQEAASLSNDLRRLRPFVDHDLGQDALAKCLDAKNGVYLVRETGDTDFRVVDRKRFSDFEKKVSAEGQILHRVDVIERQDGTSMLQVSRLTGGRLDGDRPEAPAILRIDGENNMTREWWRDGINVNEAVLGDRPAADEMSPAPRM